MAEPKNMDALVEVEYCLGRYLDANIAGVMDDVRSDLTRKQGEERAEWNLSLGGILSAMADASHCAPGIDTSSQILKATGEWNSKTTEDYLVMCKEAVVKDKELYHDIVDLTIEWRKAMVESIGRERYDQASKQIGCDLASAYVDYRLQQTMIDRLIDKETPKSTAEYIIRKAAGESLFGLPYTLNRSPLEAQIAAEAEAKYKANGWEWGGAKAASFAIDTVATMGCGSWANLAKLAGVEVVFAGVEAYVDSKKKDNTITIEQCISQGIFGSGENENVFDSIKAKAGWLDAAKSEGVARINSNLKRPVGTFSLGGFISRGATTLFAPLATLAGNFKKAISQTAQNAAQQSQQGNDVSSTRNAEAELAARSSNPTSEQPMEDNTRKEAENPEDDKIRQEQEANQAGWGSLMSDLGFTGLGDIGHNLGYVIAMMPDILVGMLTGKTQSLHLRDNLIPMASVVAGLFVKNPVLKMVLIGMGGLNLVNKAGHESIERHNNPDGPRFKRYDDQELNPRITGPVINGNCLVANIDRTPCSVMLPDNVVAAYQSGALPLNTLANAVLARHDANSLMAQENYRAATQENQSQTRQIR
ncbi:MAG: hypothetical protein ACI3YG_00415 [Prevotella sp.]